MHTAAPPGIRLARPAAAPCARNLSDETNPPLRGQDCHYYSGISAIAPSRVVTTQVLIQGSRLSHRKANGNHVSWPKCPRPLAELKLIPEISAKQPESHCCPIR